MGPQSSGKSTLLNHLFGTKFKEMDALAYRGQTTQARSRRAWAARRVRRNQGFASALRLRRLPAPPRRRAAAAARLSGRAGAQGVWMAHSTKNASGVRTLVMDLEARSYSCMRCCAHLAPALRCGTAHASRLPRGCSAGR